jgi:hypothetical protein
LREPQNFVSVASSFTNIRQVIAYRSDSFLIVKNDNTVVMSGQKNSISYTNVSSPSSATVPTAAASQVSQAFYVNGDFYVKKTNGSLLRWFGSTTAGTVFASGLTADPAKTVGTNFLLYENGNLATTFTLPSGVPNTGIKDVWNVGTTMFLITNDKQYYIIDAGVGYKTGSFSEIAYNTEIDQFYVQDENGIWSTVLKDETSTPKLPYPEDPILGHYFNPTLLETE